MGHVKRDTLTCGVCGRETTTAEALPAGAIRRGVAETIHRLHPEWLGEGFVCRACLNQARAEYVQEMMRAERGELSSLEHKVLETLQAHGTISANTNEQFESKLTFGQRMADRIAAFGGSWAFIGLFACVLVIWMTVNVSGVLAKPFDPYPFILLNLVLSCLAAIQAPVIMMSQNRQEQKDRLRAEHDYQVNLKAELEIRSLHEKLDHVMEHQWERLAEIQQVQIDLMNELSRRAER